LETDFQQNYEALSDEELLMIAASRAQLEDGAARAMDSEMARRGLTYEQAQAKKGQVARLTARENRERHTKSKDTKYFVAQPKIYLALVVVAIVFVAYLLLIPRAFRIPDEWEEAAVAALTGASMAFFCVQPAIRRTTTFWISMVVACIVQVLACHWLIMEFHPSTRGAGKGIWLLSILAGYVIGAAIFLLLQRFEVKEKSAEGLW
jgi:hypothetical protein